MAKNLNLAGARFRNLPVRVNLHLYTVFIRPGLEYGLPLLLGDRKALHLLEMCQKRIVCGFLGVNINSRNDVVQAISNCPPDNLGVGVPSLKLCPKSTHQGLPARDFFGLQRTKPRSGRSRQSEGEDYDAFLFGPSVDLLKHLECFQPVFCAVRSVEQRDILEPHGSLLINFRF